VIEVREYTDRLGRNPFRRWFEKLNGEAQARITVAVERVTSGNLAGAKSVGAGVSEVRLDFGPGYRIYFGRDGETLVILLGGGTKKRQSTDIEAAKILWHEYKAGRRSQ